MSAPHAAVWLNADEAHIYRFGAGEVEKRDVKANGDIRDDRAYFEAILAELTEVEGWMIAGPTGPLKDFEKYVRVGHAEQLGKKLVGVEAMDHPRDGELLRHARRRLAF
ncbi:hypothetical protein [Reyranella sp.]|uniref:hypothetical protein n=1 Tax=Reyranella sp. TaxID=1929291 RepID=UPI000BCE85CC|nr:hypothetical protein [Reyranella sp.]OYY44847.1 MAG: hypothetical protein B7Y57_06910 [Rhodospirillales bacterium 35-66-84]OYZ95315.1 MAG: hypothetical protein B7Y08_08330 [Rhodospirillales bacterium 24-66-33]OZB26910.1 MAG: hypothetical protein B7X63_07260 [Rhodospirillales bacterium 39-66-50]HQS16062.1 hypothetical protein [Reyranella sp.]HQT11692.1 hypothetical protein [Reyranella sp.]